MRLEVLLGRRVRYRGEVGLVVSGCAVAEAGGTLALSLPRANGAPRREVIVPASEWGELELLDGATR